MRNEANRCVIWGIGVDYERILNQIFFEIHKGNMTVKALVCRQQDKYCSSKDGFSVIAKEELKLDDFDYLIITSKRYFKEIKDEAIKLGVVEHRIIEGAKFELPLFDFGRYVQLLENPITILSDDCWGAYAYNRLGLRFSSPLMNIQWDTDEYAKFVMDPMFYLQTELTMVQEGNLPNGVYPIGQLGDNDRNVKLQLVHSIDFATAKELWDRRKKRINPNNVFVKMGIKCSDKNKAKYLKIFEQVPYNKVLFYGGNTDAEGVFKTNRFTWHQSNIELVKFWDYSDWVRLHYYESLDLLKLLTGAKDYSRDK